MNVTYIDTCLSCYLQDHHNRPGEILLGVAVDGSTTYQEILDELLQDLNCLSLDPDEFDYDVAETAIRDEFSTVSDMSKPFDSSLEISGDNEKFGDPCQAWFLLEFDEVKEG